MRPVAMVLGFSVVAFLETGCTRVVPPAPTRTDELGCAIPPASTFQRVGFSLEVAQAHVGGASVAGGKVALTPDVVTLVSQAVQDEQVLTYLNCRVRKAYPPEEAQWYTLLDSFMRSHPSPEQVAAWQRDHPSPSEVHRRQEEQRRQEEADRQAQAAAAAERARLDRLYADGLPRVQGNIDWMWGEDKDRHNPPSDPRDMDFIIVGDQRRGTASARDCVIHAAEAAAQGDSATAVRWLMAGQAHNGGVQQSFVDNKYVALRYARAKAGI